MEASISNISRTVEQRKKYVSFQIFPGYEQIDVIRFPIFPGFWSANLIIGVNFAIRFRLEINLIMTPRNYYNYPRWEELRGRGAGGVIGPCPKAQAQGLMYWGFSVLEVSGLRDLRPPAMPPTPENRYFYRILSEIDDFH